MKDIQRAHKAMAAELRKNLEKNEIDRLKTFQSMMTSIQKEVADIETYVAEKLKEFSNSHDDMSDALKKELAKYVANVVSETRNLLGGFTGEREKMTANWEALTIATDKKERRKTCRYCRR